MVATTCLTLSNAILREDSPRPRFTESITVQGTQAEHTMDSRGRAKHPFRQVPKSVHSIHYPESNTFSTKLSRTRAGGRNRGHELRSDGYRTIGSGTNKTE